MGLFRRIGNFLGFVKDEAEELRGEEERDSVSSSAFAAAQELPRKGFSVSVQVPVDRPPTGPLLIPCSSGDGGVQGFKWYAKRLRIDEDGDVADEFLDEILSEKPVSFKEQKRSLPSFQVKYNARPVKSRHQVRSIDGKIQLGVESQGRLEWV